LFLLLNGDLQLALINFPEGQLRAVLIAGWFIFGRCL